MRRTIFLALLAALALASPARATDPITILRDCVDDSVLQGNYSASDLRKARNELPTDSDEYSDCRDVISRAIAGKTSGSAPSPTPDAGGSGGDQSSGGGTAGGSGGGGGSSPTATPEPTTEPAPSATPVATLPETQQDWDAITAAQQHGADRRSLSGRDVTPMLTAEIGRNGVPASLLTSVGLIVAALVVALLLPPLRRRVARHGT